MPDFKTSAPVRRATRAADDDRLQLYSRGRGGLYVCTLVSHVQEL